MAAPLVFMCAVLTSVPEARGQSAPEEPSAQPQDAVEEGAPAGDARAQPWPRIDDATPAPDLAAALSRGEALMAMGDWRGAAQELSEVVKAEPNHVVALERLRDASAQGGEPEVALELTARLARAYLHQNNRELASERLDQLIAAAPEHPEVALLNEALGRLTRDRSEASTWGERARSLLGIFVLLGVTVLMSSNWRRIRLRVVLWGIGLQAIFGLFIMRTNFGEAIFDGVRRFVDGVLSFTDAGASFLFGNLYNGIFGTGTQGPVQYVDGTSGDPRALGVVFAFHVLPTIIFFGALMSVLYHLGIVQKVVKGIAWVMQRIMGTSGAESLSAAGNIFVGQTEAPLLVKPYLEEMTTSELMAVMCGGFATVAGGVLAAYVRFGIDAGHLLAASVMSAPAALVVAKILQPETEVSKTAGGAQEDIERTTTNVIDAAATGATDGLKLAFNVAAMLVAFIALIALINGGLGWFGGLVGFDGLSLKAIFGWFFYPISWCMGVSTQDLLAFGNLLGTKVAVNEFVAYVELGLMRQDITPRTFTIATYALCGFANFSSIGIQIGGIAAIAPSRRKDLARLGLRAMLGGAIASWLTACVAGILL